MAVETGADRLVFLAAADFGILADYTPVTGGTAAPVSGIFDNDYLQTEGGSSSAATLAPRFLCRTADLAAGGKRGDTLVIDGATYKVTVPHPDGTGMTTLWLEKQ